MSLNANMCSMSRIISRLDASILHADLDSFYASVEQRDDPSLRGRPVIVGGGIVLAASYEAKRFGVYTPMPERSARRLCPDVIVVPPRFDAYMAASKAVFTVFHDTTPIVEGLSIDEAFLDVSGLRRTAGSPVDIATKLRADVRQQVGLAITVGVARTKFLAKVASAVGKPDGLLVVEPDGELEFLHPLAVGRLWGVGPVTERKLHERGLRTVGEVAKLGEAHLVAMLGPGAGRHLHALAHNLDPRPVEGGKRRRSIGSQRAMNRGPKTATEIETMMLGIVDRVTRRMRDADRVGRTVIVHFRFEDFQRATRSRTLPARTNATDRIQDVAIDLLAEQMPVIAERGLTLLGLSVGNLVNAAESTEQLEFSLDGRNRDALDDTLDNLHQKFGSSSVLRASLLGRDPGFQAPMLPD